MPPRGGWRKPFAISWPGTPSRTRCLCIADLVCIWACQEGTPARSHKSRIGTSRGNRRVRGRRNSTAATPAGNRRVCCRPAIPNTRNSSGCIGRSANSSTPRCHSTCCCTTRGFQPRPSPAPLDTSRDPAVRGRCGTTPRKGETRRSPSGFYPPKHPPLAPAAESLPSQSRSTPSQGSGAPG